MGKGKATELLVDAFDRIVKLTDLLDMVSMKLAEIFDCVAVTEAWTCAAMEDFPMRSEEDASLFVSFCNNRCLVRKGLSMSGKVFKSCRTEYLAARWR